MPDVDVDPSTDWLPNEGDIKVDADAKIGEICGYQENEMFFRVQVLQLIEQGSHEKGAATTDAEIMFIDSGRVEQISVIKLYKLPEELKAVNIQASVFVHTELHGREMEGKIVLRLGHRLWLDPLVMRLKLGETRTIINKFSVHTELIRNGLADENPSHLERLFKMIQGKVNIPRALMIKTKQEEDDVLQEPQVGKYCLAQYASFDERWYRGHIQTVKDDTVEIFFPDYGDLDFVPRDKVREFPVDKFFELPLQAIECKLANIEKIGDTWEIRAGDALWDMSHFVNEKDLRPLVATVVQAKEETKYAGRQKFVVELRTTQRDLGQELVWRQLAKHTPDCTKYTPLLPRSTPGKRVFPSRLHKIPGLCSAVYWEKDLCKATKLAEELYNILSECLGSLSTTQESVAKEGLVSLVKMVGRVTQPEIHKTIFECLLCYVKAGDRILVQFTSARLQTLSPRLLISQSDCRKPSEVQGALCQAFASLTSGSDGGHDDFKKESLMEAIVKNLQKTDCPKCIAFCVQQCDHFASTRRKHKTFLIEHHMITILNRILDLEMPPATKQLCKDLKTSLDFKVPSEPIRGLLLKPGMQHMGPMSDRALSRGVNYGFTYRLYDRVFVEKCTWHVKQREVLVSLKKQEKGMWSRPLHDKIKHGNVVADCEHILDSSDSEEEDDQRPFLLTKGKKKKSMFRGMKQSTVQVGEPEDTETDTSDSLENMDPFNNRTDYDFDNIAYQNPL
ncbi:TDR12-like protein [Mya arenaria]|uniref:RNA helicase n=1 Tax=Mya arenaria TaxID=6604 RepID=A0ABY7ET21_MYAAR|nr:TDR12-like protein [Mya arenaria]